MNPRYTRDLNLKKTLGLLIQEMNLKVVVMLPEAPSAAMLAILADPVYSLNVFYLEGSALNDKDLTRARADAAIGIFIMTNKNSINADEEDAKTVLHHFCVRRHCRFSKATSAATCCLQMIRPENRRHLQQVVALHFF